ALGLERPFERFSWSCVLDSVRRLPDTALLFLNVNPRLIGRSDDALAGLGEETERRGVSFSRLVLDLVEVEKMPGATESSKALKVPRELRAANALYAVNTG